MKSMTQLILLGSLATLMPVLGCHARQGILGVDRCAKVPQGAIPEKPGNHLCEWQQAQVRAASIDRGVFYQSDFVGKSDRLSPAAEQQVARLVQHGAIGNVQVILEPSDDSQRDTSRKIMLASAFTAAGAPMAAEQIQIAHPPAIGLEGFRAQQVARTASRSGMQGGGKDKEWAVGLEVVSARGLVVEDKAVSEAVEFSNETLLLTHPSHRFQLRLFRDPAIQANADRCKTAQSFQRFAMSQLGVALPAMKPGDDRDLKKTTADQMAKHGYWSEAVELYLQAESMSPRSLRWIRNLHPPLPVLAASRVDPAVSSHD